MWCRVISCFSNVWLFETPRTVAHQASLPVGFSQQEYWSGLPCPPPGDLPNPETEPMSPLHAGTLPAEPLGMLLNFKTYSKQDPVCENFPIPPSLHLSCLSPIMSQFSTFALIRGWYTVQLMWLNWFGSISLDLVWFNLAWHKPATTHTSMVLLYF